MLEKPPLDDAQLIACLRASYGLRVTDLTFLPLGYDSNAGVYRATTTAGTVFVKVKRDAVDPVTVLLPRYLLQNGVPEAVAPLQTRTADPWGMADDFSVLVYPFIEEAETATLPDHLRVRFGEILHRLHAVQLPPDLAALVRRETFTPHPIWRAAADKIQAEILTRDYRHPIERETADFWRAHHTEIALIINRVVELGERLRGKSPDLVLCHSDIHMGNLLLDSAGGLHIVDWEQPVLALRECDLLFAILGGFVTDLRDEALFFEGYGPAQINPLALAFYRYGRAMEDIGAFGETIFSPENTDETKRDALKWLKAQFDPGGIIESAHLLMSDAK